VNDEEKLSLSGVARTVRSITISATTEESPHSMSLISTCILSFSYGTLSLESSS
jgi:hypothetical protein